MATVSTYHCFCNELILATTCSLPDLPKRQGDGTLICKVSTDDRRLAGASVLTSTVTVDQNAVVLKLDDGFEKRYAVNCSRCGLMFGYQLDRGQWEESENETGARDGVVFLVPGGLMSTEDVEKGKKLDEREVEVKIGPVG